jgi:hypothetical protein
MNGIYFRQKQLIYRFKKAIFVSITNPKHEKNFILPNYYYIFIF